MALTGTIDFRKSWFGGIVLQVEEEVKPRFSSKVKRRWRRATLMDLAQPELRILIDLRSRPDVLSRTSPRPVPPTLAVADASLGAPSTDPSDAGGGGRRPMTH